MHAVLKPLVLTAVLLWVAPFLSITVPRTVFSCDSMLAVLACVTRIPEALSIVQEERERTAAEEAAFENFSERVVALNTTEVKPATPTAGTTLTSPETETAAQLEDVRAAYRNTVMTVPHYEEEYDEPLTENMAAELGTDLAGFVHGDDILTPNLQQALIRASHAAKQERASFRKSLDRERDTLTDARRRLRDVSESTERLATTPLDRCPFDKLLRVEHRLQNLKSDCEEILQDRQRDLQKRSYHNDLQLQAYLYPSQPWTFPVLDDALDCLSRLQEIEDWIVQSVIRRP